MDAESGTWDDLLDAGEDRLDISRLDRRRGGGSSSGVAGAAGFARDFAPARPSSASPPKGWDSRERERDGSPAREWPRSPVRDVSGHALPLQVPRPATPPVQRTHQKTSSMASVDDLSASGGSAGSVPRRSDRDRDRDRELSRHDSMEREVRDRRRQDSTDSLHSRSNPNIQLVQETGSDRVLDMSCEFQSVIGTRLSGLIVLLNTQTVKCHMLCAKHFLLRRRNPFEPCTWPATSFRHFLPSSSYLPT